MAVVSTQGAPDRARRPLGPFEHAGASGEDRRQVEVLSRSGAGTEVQLSVPGKVAFETTTSETLVAVVTRWLAQDRERCLQAKSEESNERATPYSRLERR